MCLGKPVQALVTMANALKLSYDALNMTLPQGLTMDQWNGWIDIFRQHSTLDLDLDHNCRSIRVFHFNHIIDTDSIDGISAKLQTMASPFQGKGKRARAYFLGFKILHRTMDQFYHQLIVLG